MANKSVTIKFSQLSKTLDGNLLIGDHEQVYFILSPEKRKITLLSKQDMKEEFFMVQKRFLEFAAKYGMIVMGSESTGYLPGMFEFSYPESDKYDSVKVMLRLISMFLVKEKEVYDRINAHEKEMEKLLLDPDDDNSTELGEVPQEELKGVKINNPYVNYMTSWFGWYV